MEIAKLKWNCPQKVLCVCERTNGIHSTRHHDVQHTHKKKQINKNFWRTGALGITLTEIVQILCSFPHRICLINFIINACNSSSKKKKKNADSTEGEEHEMIHRVNREREKDIGTVVEEIFIGRKPR